MDPRDAFISYVEEDAAFAGALGTELRSLGHSTWTYEDDGIPGESYLTQVHAAIAVCKVFILVATPRSVHAHQVIREVEQAHERQKIIIPVRLNITHAEFAAANPILQMASGTAVSLASDGMDTAKIAQRLQMTIQRVRAAEVNTQPTAAPTLSADIAEVVSQEHNGGTGTHDTGARAEPSVISRFCSRPLFRRLARVLLGFELYCLSVVGGSAVFFTPRVAKTYHTAVGLGVGVLGLLWLSLAVMVMLFLLGRTHVAQGRIALLITTLATSLALILAGVFAVWDRPEAEMYAAGVLGMAAACLLVFPVARWLKKCLTPSL